MIPKKRKNRAPSSQEAKRMKKMAISPGDCPEKVCVWLKSIGLKSEYIETFREEGIDATELLYDVDMRLLLVDFKFPQLRAKRLLQKIEKLRQLLPESQRVTGRFCDHCKQSTHGVPHQCLENSEKKLCWDCFLYQSSYGSLPAKDQWKKWKELPQKIEEEEQPAPPTQRNRKQLKDSFSLFTELELIDFDDKGSRKTTTLKRIPGVTRSNSQTILDVLKGGKFTLSDLSRILNETTDGIICWENWRKRHLYVNHNGKYMGHDQQIKAEKPATRLMLSSWDLDLREETPPPVSPVRTKSRKTRGKSKKAKGKKADKKKQSKPKPKTKSKSKPKPNQTSKTSRQNSKKFVIQINRSSENEIPQAPKSTRANSKQFVNLSQHYKGVYITPDGKFGTMMTVGGVKFSVGDYETEIEAAQVVNQKCKDLGMRMKNPAVGLPPPKSPSKMKAKPVTDVKEESSAMEETESIKEPESSEKGTLGKAVNCTQTEVSKQMEEFDTPAKKQSEIDVFEDEPGYLSAASLSIPEMAPTKASPIINAGGVFT